MAKIEVLDAIVTSCWLGNNPQRFPCLAFSVCGQGSKVLSVNDAAMILHKLVPGVPLDTQPHFVEADASVRVRITFRAKQATFHVHTDRETLIHGAAPVQPNEKSDFLKTWRQNADLGILITLRDDFSVQDADADFRLRTEMFTALVRNVVVRSGDSG